MEGFVSKACVVGAIVLICAAQALAFGSHPQCRSPSHLRLNGTLSRREAIPENLRVVFLGDQGLSKSKSVPVLAMVKNFNPAFVVHSGDFDYKDDPAGWMEQLETNLGSEIPYFVSIGNHDVAEWATYQSLLVQRYARTGIDKFCQGDLGVNMACSFMGVGLVFSGVGTSGTGHVEYMDKALTEMVDTPWKFVSWHKNQHVYQTGSKTDETGYAIYDLARQHGAIIATGHEHSYSRTLLMNDFATQGIASTNATYMRITPGETFAFVSGVAGKEIRPWVGGAENNPWWASVAASDNGLTYGALYCVFNLDGDENLAHCQQIDINGKIWDDYYIENTPAADASLLSAQRKKAASCPQDFREVPVAQDGVVTLGGTVQCEAVELPLASRTAAAAESTLVAMRFDGVPISANNIHLVKSVHLQVMGTTAEGEAHISIRATAEPAALACGSNVSTADWAALSARATRASVTWSENDGGAHADEWARHDVWVSEDLTPLFIELAASWSSESNDVQLLLSGVTDAASRVVYSHKSHPCQGPTLAVQFKVQC